MMKAAMLILAMLLTFICSGASATQEGPTEYGSGDYVYIIMEDGTAEICDYRGDALDLNIPDTLDGYAVTRIGDQAFNECTELESVTIGPGVETVGTNPFTGCECLTEIFVSPGNPRLFVQDGVLFDKQDMRLISCPMTFSGTSYVIPEGTKIVGDQAFQYCAELESIVIGTTVETVYANPFIGCESLTDIVVSPGNPRLFVQDEVLFDKQDMRLICCLMTASGEMYPVPDGTGSIGEGAFGGCSGISGVAIPQSVTSIGKWAFSGCTGLTNLAIGNSVTSIGEGAFSGCESLAGLSIPKGVKIVEDRLCSACCGLVSVTIPEGVTSIGDFAFYTCWQLAGLDIPKSVAGIGEGAFWSCESLTTLVIPEGVTRIGNGAFAYCSGVTSLMLYGGVSSIGDNVFSRCESLTGVRIPEGVASIEDGAFDGCLSLKDVWIPDSVTSIGDEAFAYCESLTGLTIPVGVTSIGEEAFAYCDMLTLTVDRGSYAEAYAIGNEISYIYPDANDFQSGFRDDREQAGEPSIFAVAHS